MKFPSLFGTKFDDEKLAAHAKIAITEDPLVQDHGGVNVLSNRGVITLNGVVHREAERDRIEGVVRSAINNMGYKYDRIENELKVEKVAQL